MSTQATIGVRLPGGAITYIWCLNDGYPAGVGAILVDHYQSTAKVRELVKLGNLASLGAEIGVAHPGTGALEAYIYHGWCTALHRDQGYPWDACKSTRASEKQFAAESFADYAYLFKGRRWLYKSRTAPSFAPIPEDLLAREETQRHTQVVKAYLDFRKAPPGMRAAVYETLLARLQDYAGDAPPD